MPTTRSGVETRGGDLGHRQRRRVRRENRVGPDDPLEVTKELELGAEVFHDRLDHEIAVGEVGEVGRQRKRPERVFALDRPHLLLVDLALEKVRDAVSRLLCELDRHFATDGLEAGFDRQLRDTGAHGAEAHDADSTDLRDGHDRRDPTRA